MTRVAFFILAILALAGDLAAAGPPSKTFETTRQSTTNPAPIQRGYTIPTVDLADQTTRQTVVDREPGQYLGHVTTVLLADGRTIIAVYPKGHGRGPIVMKRSTDGGRTWSERLPVPENWATSQEVPTIHRVVDPQGVGRLILFSGLYPVRMSVSEDDGRHWTPLQPVGAWGGIVTMGSVERLRNGDYLAMFHDDGRFFRENGKPGGRMTLYQTTSKDGGLTWGEPKAVFAGSEIHLCEPGVIRSPDGRQLAVLLRENQRKRNSYVIFSNDEAMTWSKPRELPGALTGDRHTGKYGPDGRLFISFRDTTRESPTKGDWVAWVGTYEDIVQGREGQYRVRLMKNHKDADCAYPGVEVLPDGTFVTTTYGHWIEGEQPFIVSVRLKLDELDAARSFIALVQKIEPKPAQPYPGYELVWADEFNTEGPPDPADWIHETGFVRNQEAQWYQSQNARCSAGLLVIEARHERVPNPQHEADSADWKKAREHAEYTSASIKTRDRHEWLYGRFEMRGRIDTRAGLWPAFWTVGTRRPWPGCGEIDVMEYYRGLLLANAAWASPNPGVALWDDSKTPIKDLAGQEGAEAWAKAFHIWRMDWDEGNHPPFCG